MAARSRSPEDGRAASLLDCSLRANPNHVYVLVDTRDRSILYVGKGTGNRVFEPADEARESANATAAAGSCGMAGDSSWWLGATALGGFLFGVAGKGCSRRRFGPFTSVRHVLQQRQGKLPKRSGWTWPSSTRLRGRAMWLHGNCLSEANLPD